MSIRFRNKTLVERLGVYFVIASMVGFAGFLVAAAWPGLANECADPAECDGDGDLVMLIAVFYAICAALVAAGMAVLVGEVVSAVWRRRRSATR